MPPDELEFFEREFGLSPLHDRDEAVISYIRTYADGRDLTVTFDAGTSMHVVVRHASVVLAALTLEGIETLCFQSWHGERIIRVGFRRDVRIDDLRIHYDPAPSIHLALTVR